MKKVIFTVVGRVQGVFFRKYTQQKAQSLGISGEARNMSDGSVQVIAVASDSAITDLERWLWKGSPMSKVKTVRRVALETDIAKNDAPQGFLVK